MDHHQFLLSIGHQLLIRDYPENVKQRDSFIDEIVAEQYVGEVNHLYQKDKLNGSNAYIIELNMNKPGLPLLLAKLPKLLLDWKMQAKRIQI